MNRMIKKGVFVLFNVFVTHSHQHIHTYIYIYIYIFDGMYICFVIVSISDVCLLNINIMFMYFYNVDVVCMSMRALMEKGTDNVFVILIYCLFFFCAFVCFC